MSDEEKNVQVMEFAEDDENPSDAPETETSSPSGNFFSKLVDNKLYVAIAALGFVFVVAIIYTSGAFTGMTVGNTLAPEVVGESTLEFLNSYLLTDVEATLISIEEESGLYKVLTTVNGQEVPIYSTLDAKYIILPQGFIDVEEYVTAVEAVANQPAPTTGDIPKTDKPVINLFVMSYCPYGLQMQKAALPVMELLGDKVDFNMNFVHYLMHGKKEMTENNNQYCIQKEQPEVFVDYLKCLVQTDDTVNCRKESGVDETTLETCLAEVEETFKPTEIFDSSTERYQPYPVDAQLSNFYGVGGSPTMVINGKTVSVNRSPEAVKQAICSAFNTPPEECQQTLSSEPASSGIGPMGGGSDTSATC